MTSLPSALKAFPQIEQAIQNASPAIFLDYDGTLTPIVSRPELAILSPEMKSTLRALARQCPVAIISGRFRPEVEKMVGIPELIYAGSHGFDIQGPQIAKTLSEAEPLLPSVEKAYQALQQEFKNVPGCLIENKKYALAVHYRLVSPDLVPHIKETVKKIVQANHQLRMTSGKMVFEIRVNFPWDKGKALLFVLDSLPKTQPGYLPLYLGDDDTDEDAFQVLQKKGIGILVSEHPQATKAKYLLTDPNEVKILLEKITACLKLNVS